MPIAEDTPVYPFSWLDDLIEVRLNPASAGFCAPAAEPLQELQAILFTETERLYTHLKAATFPIFPRENVVAIVQRYLEVLGHLRVQATENLAAWSSGSTAAEIGETILFRLDEVRRHIEKRYRSLLTAEDKTTPPGTKEKPPFKVQVRLSVDQLAILLRAADESGLLVSRSLSLVFRSIVPFLSTDKIKDISWNSARSSTYKTEENDKAIAVAALEELIKRIRRF